MNLKFKHIKENVINQIDLSELDFKLENDFSCDIENDETLKIFYDENSEFKYWREGDYLNIDDLLFIIQNLKKDGANYVQIYSHGDHHGYYITGVEFKEIKNKNEFLKKELTDDLTELKKRYENESKNIRSLKSKIFVLENKLKNLDKNISHE